MDRNKLIAAVLAGTMATGALGIAGAAYAKSEQESATNEAAILANAKVTMAQAIATAEGQVGGKTVGTGIEDQNGTVTYEVEVLKDGKTHKVLVDTQTGQVVKTALADTEQGENGEENDSE